MVARYRDGRVLKGTTMDFAPSKERFHFILPTSSGDTFPEMILTEDLKALFYVRDFEGDPAHVEQQVFARPAPPGARQIRTAFIDGEVLVGTTTSYRPGVPGFFVVPADTRSNNERCYVVASATVSVQEF